MPTQSSQVRRAGDRRNRRPPRHPSVDAFAARVKSLERGISRSKCGRSRDGSVACPVATLWRPRRRHLVGRDVRASSSRAERRGRRPPASPARRRMSDRHIVAPPSPRVSVPSSFGPWRRARHTRMSYFRESARRARVHSNEGETRARASPRVTNVIHLLVTTEPQPSSRRREGRPREPQPQGRPSLFFYGSPGAAPGDYVGRRAAGGRRAFQGRVVGVARARPREVFGSFARGVSALTQARLRILLTRRRVRCCYARDADRAHVPPKGGTAGAASNPRRSRTPG